MGAGASTINNTTVFSPENASSGDAASMIFEVSLSPQSTTLELQNPGPFHLRIAKESLDFLDIGTKMPIVNFPYQAILCWGSSATIFHFTVDDVEESFTRDGGFHATAKKVVLNTSLGNEIERLTMKTVRELMADMEKSVVSPKDFNELKGIIIKNGKLVDCWMDDLLKFTASGRSFIARQAMELLDIIEVEYPFEKFDLACFLYEQMINKDSFQLVINCFANQIDRDNLIHRLGINKKQAVVTASANNNFSSTTVPASPS